MNESKQDGRPTSIETAQELAHTVAKRSTCIRRQAGAVALDDLGRIVGMGFNGVPRRHSHCTTAPCAGAEDSSGNTENCMAVHAEVNCIINSSHPQRIQIMVVTASPCFKCALVMANLVWLEAVYFSEVYSDERGIRVLDRAAKKAYLIIPHGLPGYPLKRIA